MLDPCSFILSVDVTPRLVIRVRVESSKTRLTEEAVKALTVPGVRAFALPSLASNALATPFPPHLHINTPASSHPAPTTV